MKECITDFTFEEVKNNFKEKNIPLCRAYQIFNWIYRKFNFNPFEMTDISKEERTFLDESFGILSLKYVNHIWSIEEEAVKFIFKTMDDNLVETVLIISPKSNSENEGRLSLCVSSQVGCPLKCEFCATGQAGFRRNLFPSEIISQILLVENFLKESKELKFPVIGENSLRRIGNIVFMGMGEPLLNLDNVFKAIRILTFSGGYNIGSRHITLSTGGIIDGIEEMKNKNSNVRLAVSLHSPFQEIREKLMPVAKNNTLKSLIASLISYQKVTGRRITFEYLLLEGINDGEKDVVALKELLKDLNYNINLISYNPIKGKNFRAISGKEVRRFVFLLEKYSIPYVIRTSKGKKINAGCGQLGTCLN